MTKVLYFTSPSCRPCRSFGPLLASELAERGIEPTKIDVSTPEGLELADAAGVNTVPTVIIVRDSEEPKRFGALLGNSLQDELSVL